MTGPPSGRARALTAGGAGLAAVAMVLVALGSRGVEDNGDGFRLICGEGLVPRTVDGIASWKGGVVTDFALASAPTCAESAPSSARLVLRAAALLSDDTLDLRTVGLIYALLVGLVVGVAAWAATATGLRRALVLVVPVAPLALPWFSRFFVSTYAEPAGLLGTVAVGCGLGAFLAARHAGPADRATALALVAVGGLVAGTAKPAYLPVLAVTVAVVAVGSRSLVRRGRLRTPVVVVAVLVGVAAVPVGAALRFQSLAYESANVHDLVFTLVLPELGPGATADLGLPGEAAAYTGTGFFNGPPHPSAAWWREAVLTQPDATRARVHRTLVSEPATVVRAIGVGLRATVRPDLPYLASGPAVANRLSPLGGDPGWSGARQSDFRRVLDAGGWWQWLPALLVAACLVIGSRRSPWCRAAGLVGITALGLVVAAVFGDGYFELFKHVWLASYVLIVAALCLVGASFSNLGGGEVRRWR
ncbi:hypothetical protein [Actinomycetospora termitidis]|uniref:Glycosyltransferase RgtA/B/C/D-like domain-containing protein n=1 Tax=Actinomycetospora termitidis TaxID=3053470 RepID=A0ABT7MBU6_9PSEU|nr:hypothetical protein [Actinomycetospora sp. Odt1-22]MDL5158135.1 hypothetical protein [Actinomycetospora sp. Odt1-22]